MKRYLFILLIPLVLLSGCAKDDAVKHEDIAYKTQIYHTSFWRNGTDYYVVTKDGVYHGVSDYVWNNRLQDIPIK